MWTITSHQRPAQSSSYAIAYLGMLLVVGLVGCASASEFAGLKGLVSQLDQVIAKQQTELRNLEIEDRRLWRALRCNNPQVADFVAEAEKCQAGQCPVRTLERVLNFMYDQRHVLIRLRHGDNTVKLHPVRLTQLKDMLNPMELTPLSRIMILTMSVSLNQEQAINLPEGRAYQFLRYIRSDLGLATAAGRLGPFPVNCHQKSQLLENYSRHVNTDRVLPGEPNSREPQIAIWIFKVDC